MRLVIFGASGPTGLHVVRQALAADHETVAVTRRPDAFPLKAQGLEVVAADVTDEPAVDRAVAGADAVISTFGVPYSRKPVSVYSDGISAILAAMATHDVSRLVCVSSTTVSEQDAPGESLWWRRAVIPLLRNVVGRTLYDDMERMEAIVRANPVEWTIVRPGGLFDTDTPTGTVSVTTARQRGRYTARADLAQVLVREAAGASAHPRAVVEAITNAKPASPLRTFWKEAFGSR